MNDSAENALCPCGCGLKYTQCCGIPDRAAINVDIVARISSEQIEGEEHLTPEIKTAIQSIHSSPDLFPVRMQFSDDKAYLVKMSPQWYRESVFLDPARIRGTCLMETNLEWLQQVCERITWQPTNYIFHTAFCGSTLMAQALDAMYNCLPLREPEALGSLIHYLNSQKAAAEEKQAWLSGVMKLFSRRYNPQQNVVVKANDNANPLLMELLAWQQDIPILFMYTPLQEFLVGCLKTKNRREWIQGRFSTIKAKLPGMFDLPEPLELNDNAYGEMAAAYWSHNIALYYQAWRNSPLRIYSLDFNQMLANPMASIQACAQLFKLEARTDIEPDSEIEKLFGVYSKNSKFKYSPQQRSDDINRILSENSEHQKAAEALAQKLLKEDYPQQALPGALLPHADN